MLRFRSATVLLVLMAAIIGLVVSGCGGSGGSSSTGGGESSSTASESLNGPPIKLMVLGPFEVPPGAGLAFPEIQQGAEAAADSINANGGVNGSPIELEVCDTHFDKNQDTACGRQAVSNETMAIVGAASPYDNYLTVTNDAGIPSVGNFPLGPADLTEPTAFPLVGGFPPMGAAIGTILTDVAHAKKIVFVTSPVTASDAAQIEALEAGLAARGVELMKTVDVPPGAADLSSFVASAMEGDADGIIIALDPSGADKFTLGLKQAGYEGAISRAGATIPESSIETLGASAEGILVPSNYELSKENPAVAEFAKQMEEAHGSTATLDENSANAWAAVNVVAELAKHLKKMDAASLLKALESASNVETGISAPVDFAAKPPNPEFPRLFNMEVAYSKVEGGELVKAWSKGFINPYEKP